MLRRSVGRFGFLSALLVALAFYHYGNSVGDDLDLAHEEQCGIEYRVQLRQIIEHADQLSGQASSLFLVQLGQLESRPCLRPTRHEGLPAMGGVDRLRPVALAATTEAGKAAYLNALFSLFTEVGKRSHLDADSSADGRYSWSISQDLFVAAMPVLTRPSTDPGGVSLVEQLLHAIPQGDSLATGRSDEAGARAFPLGLAGRIRTGFAQSRVQRGHSRCA